MSARSRLLVVLVAIAVAAMVASYAFGLTGPDAGAAHPTALSGGSPSASLAETGPVAVSLGIYSGRPDPSWTLTAEEAEGLVNLLASLPEGTGAPPVGGLGYHGFTIALPEGTLVAYRGSVAPPGDGERAVRADPTRSVERYLLETSRSHLTAVEASEVERALTTP